MPMYNLIEFCDNYSDTSGSVWKFKRDEQNMNNSNPANFTTADSTFLKYKLSFIKESTTVGGNRIFKSAKIASCPIKLFD